MSPQYEPPAPKVGRLTIVNIAFLGLNVVVGVVLVYALWRGGRAVMAPAEGTQPADRADRTASLSDPPPVLDGATAPSGTRSGDSANGAASGSNTDATNVANGSSAGARLGANGAAPPAGAALAPPGGPQHGLYPAGDSRNTSPVTRMIPTGASPSGTSTSTSPSAANSAAAAAAAAARPGSGAPSTATSSTPTRTDPRTGFPITPIPRGSPYPSGTPTSPTPPPPTHGSDHDGDGTRDTPTPPDPPPVEIEPGSDRTPPVLDSLAFDPAQINDGAASNLVIRVHDDMSGVRTVTGNVKSPGGGAIFSFEGQSDGSGTTFVARIVIPTSAETGFWYVANLFVPDRADNTLIGSFTAQNAPAGARLNVLSSQSDSTPPSVRHVSMENGSVRGGEHNRIQVEVTDDQSGVATIVGYFMSPGRSAQISFSCRQEPDTNIWSGDFIVPANADCGEWTVQQIRLNDRAGNSATIAADSPLLSRVGFDVVTEGCDSTAPELQSIELSPTSVSNEAAVDVVVTLNVHDEGGGATAVSGWAAGPVSTNGNAPTLSFSAARTNPADPNSPWTGRIHVPQYAARGTWKMGRIRLTDKAQNVREYTPTDSIMFGATFEVQ